MDLILKTQVGLQQTYTMFIGEEKNITHLIKYTVTLRACGMLFLMYVWPPPNLAPTIKSTTETEERERDRTNRALIPSIPSFPPPAPRRQATHNNRSATHKPTGAHHFLRRPYTDVSETLTTTTTTTATNHTPLQTDPGGFADYWSKWRRRGWQAADPPPPRPQRDWWKSRSVSLNTEFPTTPT